jgi:hypothetical protein
MFPPTGLALADAWIVHEKNAAFQRRKLEFLTLSNRAMILLHQRTPPVKKEHAMPQSGYDQGQGNAPPVPLAALIEALEPLIAQAHAYDRVLPRGSAQARPERIPPPASRPAARCRNIPRRVAVFAARAPGAEIGS